MADPAVVGIDLGTSAVKVLAVTTAGRQIALGSAYYGLETPQPGFVEQDPEAVYAATMRVLADVVAQVRREGSAVAAIGLSSAMHGVVCVDERGTPLGRAITWMDRRSDDIVAAWRRDGTAEALYRETGAPLHPMLPIAKLAWLRAHEPDMFARAVRFVGLKELFVYRWTGQWLVDWGIAGATGMFALATRDWSARALALAGIDATRLATPVPPSTALPALDSTLVLASSDGALANIGSGAAHGDVAVTLGTSGAVRTLRPEPVLDPQGRTFCYPADDRNFIVGGPTSSAGAALDWTFALLLAELPKEQRFLRAAALAGEIPPGADGATVLPFLAGERAPYWNAALRASFGGLDLAHDRRTILRAAFEGVVFGVFAVYDALRERTGDATRLLLSGGLTKAELVRTMIADVFGVPALEPRQPDASALGAALLAAQARGLIADAAEAARSFGYDAPTAPNPANTAAYREAYNRYRSAVEAALTELRT